MGDNTSWGDNLERILISYRWIIAGAFVLVALSQGWIQVPLIDRFVDWVVSIIGAGVPG